MVYLVIFLIVLIVLIPLGQTQKKLSEVQKQNAVLFKCVGELLTYGGYLEREFEVGFWGEKITAEQKAVLDYWKTVKNNCSNDVLEFLKSN